MNMLQGTPIHHLFMDPYIACCSGALICANISLAFLEPTISAWMEKAMPGIDAFEIGLIWLPAFFPHVAGVYLTILLLKKWPQYPWLLAAVGIALEGISCFFVPFCRSFWVLSLPICSVCFGIALVDTSLLPMLGYLVDTRHVSVYGSVYAIADISYSVAYALGPVIAGEVVEYLGFVFLNVLICLSNVLYAPVLTVLKKAYIYHPFEGEMQTLRGDDPGAYDPNVTYDETAYQMNGGGAKTYGSGAAPPTAPYQSTGPYPAAVSNETFGGSAWDDPAPVGQYQAPNW